MMGRAFALSIVAVTGACHVVFPIEPSEGASDARSSDGVQGPLPRVFSSPAPASSTYGAYPERVTITLAADDPTTIIYYTTDGSTPDERSPGSTTPVTGITIDTTTTLRYLGVNAAGRGSPSTDTYTVDPALQSKAGYLVTSVTLDGMSPVVTAAPGATLAARAHVRFWAQTGYTSTAQLVYGVETQDQGCIVDGRPGPYPGFTDFSVNFSVTAPTTPGTHEVRVAHIEYPNCVDAMATMALLNRGTDTRIGVIIVR